MKKVFFLIACLSISFILNAQIKDNTTLYENSFDLLSVGSYLAQSHPNWWTTWDNEPGTSKDALISNEQSASSPNSAKCAWGTDLVFKAGNRTSGAYAIDFDMYIPNNGHAYFNLLHIFNSQGSEWALSVYFNNTGGTGVAGTNILYNGVTTPFSFPFNTWFPISLFIDLDNDIANIKINNIQYAEWQFSTIEYGGAGTRQLAGANFFPPQSGAVYYIDNFVYKSLVEESNPIISATPTSIYEEVAEGASANITKQITVTNSGSSIGDYYTWMSYDFEPISGSSVFNLLLHGYENSTSIGYTNDLLIELGVKFSKNVLCDKIGTYITKMSYYLPHTNVSPLKFRIYGPYSNNSPGEVLMEFTKTNNVVDEWNEITLPQPLLIDKSELWLSVEFFQQGGTFPISVDEGPLKPGVNFVKQNGGAWHEFTNTDFGNFLIKAQSTGTPVPACWLSLTGNSSGSISGGNSAQFNAVINPSGLAYSAYLSNITIVTNDPNNPMIEIPCTLVVLPSQPAPIMNVSPTSIHEIYENATITKQIKVTNYGNATGIYNAWLEGVTDNWISLTGNTTGSVTGGGNHGMFNAIINAEGLDNGTYTATLKISTNDVKHPLFEIPCTLVVPKEVETPVNLTAIPLSDSEIKLTWEHDSETASFILFRDNNMIAENITDTQYTDTKLSQNVKYCYTVKAVVGGYQSDPSDEACATTKEVEIPVNLTAIPLSDSEIKLTWEHDNETASFILFRDNSMIAENITVTQYTDTKLSQNIEYCYTVKAVVGEHQSEPSDQTCATITVGINELQNNIKIYPNPTTGILIVDCRDAINRVCTGIEIFDMMGRKTPLNPPEGGRLPSFGGVGGGFNISHLPSGIYFLRIQTESGKMITKKVVKN